MDVHIQRIKKRKLFWKITVGRRWLLPPHLIFSILQGAGLIPMNVFKLSFRYNTNRCNWGTNRGNGKSI